MNAIKKKRNFKYYKKRVKTICISPLKTNQENRSKNIKMASIHK